MTPAPLEVRRRGRSLRLAAPLLGLLLISGGATTARAEGEGLGQCTSCDACDGVFFVPARNEFLYLLLEDLMPLNGDYDFNDASTAVNVAVFTQGGQVTALLYTFEIASVGASIRSGMGLRLPGVPPGSATATRFIGGDFANGQPLDAWANETDAVFSIVDDTRSFFPGHDASFINTPPGADYVPPAFSVVLLIELAATALDAADAPWDIFFLYAGDPGHQIHMPSYPGTDQMDLELLQQGDVDPDSPRWFTNFDGVPWVLMIPEPPVLPAREEGQPAAVQLLWPWERNSIENLFPRIVLWAQEGDVPNPTYADFFSNGVQLEHSFQAGGRPVALSSPLPVVPSAFEVPDDACVGPPEPEPLPTQVLAQLLFPPPPGEDPRVIRGAVDDREVAYVLLEDGSIACFHVDDPTNPTLLGFWQDPSPGICSDLVKIGHLIFLACDDGVRIVDVSDPLHPAGAGGIDTGPAHSVAATGDTLYVGTALDLRGYDVGPGGPILLDSTPGETPFVRTSDGHTVSISATGVVTSDYGTFTCGPGGSPTGLAVWGTLLVCSYPNGLFLYDLGDPLGPVQTWSYGAFSGGPVALDQGVLAAIQSADGRLVTADVTDPSDPTFLSDSPGPSSGTAVALFRNGRGFCGHGPAAFVVGVPPFVFATSPVEGAGRACGDEVVRLWFSNLLDPASVPGSVTIEGPSGPVAGLLDVTLNLVAFYPSAPLPPGTYDIIVTDGIRSAAPDLVPGPTAGYHGSFTVDADCLRWISYSPYMDGGDTANLNFESLIAGTTNEQVLLTDQGFELGVISLPAAPGAGPGLFTASWTAPPVDLPTVFYAGPVADVGGSPVLGPAVAIVVFPSSLDCTPVAPYVCGASVSGRVLDDQGGPQVGATIEAVDAGTAAVVASTTASAGGAYALSGLPAGSYVITASKPGFLNGVANQALAAGESVFGLDLTLVPAGPTSLLLAYSDVDNDNTFDPSNGDRLIARWEDTDEDGVCSAGDTVFTDQYPLTSEFHGFGSFTVTQHVIAAVTETNGVDHCRGTDAAGNIFAITGPTAGCITAGVPRPCHRYLEQRPNGNFSAIGDLFPASGFTVSGIRINQPSGTSPSVPSSAPFVSSGEGATTDDPFIDVVANFPAP